MSNAPAITEAETVAEKPYDASNPEDVNEGRKRAGRAKREKLEFMQAILQLPQGRKWLYKLLLACEIHRTNFMRGDPSGRDFRDGKSFIGYMLEADAKKADIELFFQMIREAEEKKWPALYPNEGID